MARRKPQPQDANRWRNRITGEGEEAPDQLLANPLNFRIHTTAQGDALAGALNTLGWIQRVVVNRRTGHVVDGHLRVRQAMQAGEATMPVLYVDLDESEERIALATLDPIAAMAGTDDAMLAELLAGVEVDDPQLAQFLAELTSTEGSEGGSARDKAPEPRTMPGEIIHLGRHRLLCGDPAEQADRDAIQGRKAGGSILDLFQLAIAAMLDKPNPAPLLAIVPDPGACDAIVEAWEKATGRAARRVPPGG